MAAPRGQRTGVDRGSRITTAVSDDRSAAYASNLLSISRHLAHKRDRSAPSAALAADRARPVGEIDSRCGMRLEVEPPHGLAVGPAVHRQRDEVRTVLDVPEDHASLLAGAAPGGGESQGAPPVALRTPQADAAAGDAVEAAVRIPGQPDKPSRRESRPVLAFVRHGRPSLLPSASSLASSTGPAPLGASRRRGTARGRRRSTGTGSGRGAGRRTAGSGSARR